MPNMNDKSFVGGLTGTAISGAGAMISAKCDECKALAKEIAKAREEAKI